MPRPTPTGAPVTASLSPPVEASATQDLCAALAHECAAVAYRLGYQAGWAASEKSAADAWTPIAERVRRHAGAPSYQELLRRSGWYAVAPGQYRARPRKGDYLGGPVPWNPTDGAEAKASVAHTGNGQLPDIAPSNFQSALRPSHVGVVSGLPVRESGTAA